VSRVQAIDPAERKDKNMLSVNHVTKKYGDFTALEDINLSLDQGIYALLAPNGAGKTTLIKLIATLLFPTKGEIRFGGTEINRLDEEYRDRLGYLPQEFGYYKNYSPAEYLTYIAALKGLKHPKERIDELLETLALSDVRKKKMRKFSGGMIQRVGVAQALLNDPEILILDEPTAGLDPKERVRLRNIISGLSRNRIILFSTHIVSDIETIANTVILLKDSKVLCADAPPKLVASLAGKVFEAPTSIPLPENAFHLSERSAETGPVTRFVCEDAETLPPGILPVAPNLEDLFLYVYR
jgi:ABC-type multidrug transport system ATPase subunit